MKVVYPVFSFLSDFTIVVLLSFTLLFFRFVQPVYFSIYVYCIVVMCGGHYRRPSWLSQFSSCHCTNTIIRQMQRRRVTGQRMNARALLLRQGSAALINRRAKQALPDTC